MRSKLQQARIIKKYHGRVCLWLDSDGCSDCICKDICSTGFAGGLEEISAARLDVAHKYLRMDILKDILDENS